MSIRQRLRIGDRSKRPALILPVYYSCPQACSIMLAGLAQALNEVPLEPGKDYYVLVVAAPDGKIIRYLYGLRFLPFDIGMPLSEAAEGTPQMSVRRILSYCFDYDSENKT